LIQDCAAVAGDGDAQDRLVVAVEARGDVGRGRRAQMAARIEQDKEPAPARTVMLVLT
jgi:hypothetical protein